MEIIHLFMSQDVTNNIQIFERGLTTNIKNTAGVFDKLCFGGGKSVFKIRTEVDAECHKASSQNPVACIF